MANGRPAATHNEWERNSTGERANRITEHPQLAGRRPQTAKVETTNDADVAWLWQRGLCARERVNNTSHTNRGSNPAESTIPSVSTFKIPSFFLKTFQKRFDYCNTNNDEKEISSDIEKKKKCLIEFASLFYKFFGGFKFSACRFGSKIDGEHQDSSSESEAEEEEYRDERDEIFYGSETKKKLLKNEKISSQLKLPVSILDVFSKKNAMDFNFSFVKSRISISLR